MESWGGRYFSKAVHPSLHYAVWAHFKFSLYSIVHFLLLQVYHDSEEGQRYIQFYKLNKFPYISILDPRTGECLWRADWWWGFADVRTHSHHWVVSSWSRKQTNMWFTGKIKVQLSLWEAYKSSFYYKCTGRWCLHASFCKTLIVLWKII